MWSLLLSLMIYEHLRRITSFAMLLYDSYAFTRWTIRSERILWKIKTDLQNSFLINFFRPPLNPKIDQFHLKSSKLSIPNWFPPQNNLPSIQPDAGGTETARHDDETTNTDWWWRRLQLRWEPATSKHPLRRSPTGSIRPILEIWSDYRNRPATNEETIQLALDLIEARRKIVTDHWLTASDSEWHKIM